MACTRTLIIRGAIVPASVACRIPSTSSSGGSSSGGSSSSSSNGLSSATGIPPLTLSLANNALTGSVSGASTSAFGTVKLATAIQTEQGTGTNVVPITSDLLINRKSGTNAVVAGLLTGNTRGDDALDVQSSRNSNTEVASGDTSVAVGVSNTASGIQSLAFGYNNTANADYSMSYGNSNSCAALGINSVLFGRHNYSSATSYASVGIGILNNTTGATINTGSGVITGSISEGTPGRLSIAVGIKNTTTLNATAVGYNNTSSGINSISVGNSNTSSNSQSVALGTTNTASAANSLSVGSTNTASANNAVSVGSNNTASGVQTNCFGALNAASQSRASAFGWGNTASGEYASAFGYTCEATSNSASAFGFNCTASNSYSSCFGANSEASGINSLALGYNSEASGQLSAAIGYNCVASGVISMAIGNGITNAVDNSIEVGADSFAKISVRTYEGLHIPESNTTDRDSNLTPSEGSIIYNTQTHRINVWDGSVWRVVTMT